MKKANSFRYFFICRHGLWCGLQAHLSLGSRDVIARVLIMRVACIENNSSNSWNSCRVFMRITLLSSMVLLNACVGTQEVVIPTETTPIPVRGFQIQIHTTEENTIAHDVAEQATAWLATLDRDDLRKMHGSVEIPVEIKWLQPYYRVRVGHFRTREEARGMMAMIAEEFPAAFIVPDTIQ